MIRDRLKSVARKAALRVFGMEKQAEDVAAGTQHTPSAPKPYDPSVIPRVVDGSGDTPGPNHKSNIGRTVLAAEVASGAPPFMVDIRPPKECAGGWIRGARLLPGQQLKERLDLLPDKATRVTIYDQTGSDAADALAAWLREQGWIGARRLVGGYAEWIEHAEPVATPEAPKGGRYVVGQMVQRKGGGRAWVQEARSAADGPRYTLWSEDGAWSADVREDDLAS